VVHIAFDATAAKNRKEEAGEFFAYATTGFAVKGSAAEEEARKRQFTANVVVEPGKGYVTPEQDVELRKLKEIKRAEAELTLQRKIELNSQLTVEQQRKLEIEKVLEIEKARQAAETARTDERELAAKRAMEEMLAGKILSERKGSAAVVDHVVKSIRVFGLSDAASQDLISKLPIREGDTLSRESMERVTAAIRRFDEHLEQQFMPTEDNAVELRIVAPGFRGEIRRRP
jgi:hypothetical protein